VDSLTDADKTFLALTAWKESRGEGRIGMLAVAYSILNRVKAGIGGTTVLDVVTKKWQYSSMTAPGDAMLVQWPHSGDDTWASALEAADMAASGSVPDPTNGATDYCNLAVAQPAWAKVYRQTAVVGHHTFFARN
jgi:N-acetylmuramoyl-L-alanine amidase